MKTKPKKVMAKKRIKASPLWWQVYISEYLANGQNARRAYMKARPKVKEFTADKEASRLMGNPRFSQALEIATKIAEETVIMSRARWLKAVTDIAMKKGITLNAAAKMKALEMTGKSLGYLTEKVEILPDEDLRQMINEARRRVLGHTDKDQ